VGLCGVVVSRETLKAEGIMMKHLRNLAAVVFATAALCGGAFAQTSDKQPRFIQNQQWVDLGNGPTEILPIEGTGTIYASGGGGVGTSAGTTALTLATTPATGTAPCVGCVITCAASNTVSPCTIPAATTVTAFNGTTGVTTSVATTTTAANLVWGSACPAATAANVPGVAPGTVPALGPPLGIRAVTAGDNPALPMFTTARLCTHGGFQNGLTFTNFPIGAH
jgi:hypothetical protein